MSFGFRVIVEGDFAAFIRPELKVERVSYDVPTPSALEGMLKSVYWKPAIRYVIDEIVVFNPIEFFNVRRNEVDAVVSLQKMRAQMCGKDVDPSIYADKSRTQRAAILLRDVKYGVAFHFELTGLKNEQETDGEKKHYNILKRRLENGQCFRQPCLGCSEFPVRQIRLVDAFNLDEISPEILRMGDLDLGYMCYGLAYEDGGVPTNGDWDNPKFSDRSSAVYYRPHMVNGIIDVATYREGLKC